MLGVLHAWLSPLFPSVSAPSLLSANSRCNRFPLAPHANPVPPDTLLTQPGKQQAISPRQGF